MRRGALRPACGLIVVPLALAGVAAGHSAPPDMCGGRLRVLLASGMDSLALAIDSLRVAADTAKVNRSLADRVPLRLDRARLAYKSVEGLLEHFDGATASILNGREAEASDDDERDAPPEEPAVGFSALDSLMAAGGDSATLADVGRHAALMARTVRYRRSLIKHLAFDDGKAELFAAIREELVRIATLGLAGFDTRAPADRASEGAAALRGLRHASTACLGTARPARDRTDSRFALAISAFGASARPSEELDAFGLIADDLYPLARAVDAERGSRGREVSASVSAWRTRSDFVFDRDAFDLLAYASGHEADTGAVLATLGRSLFSDPVLSGDGRRSCASCHHPDHAFAESRARAATIDSTGHATARNTPTLINAAYQPALFADQRAHSLEDQIAIVVSSPAEMRGNLDSAAVRLSRDAPRRRAFAGAFHRRPSGQVSAAEIQGALAAYLRSLTALDSRFDRAIRGDTAAISPSERRGFNAFMGKARCGTCHFAPLFNGAMPPDYRTAPPEVIGVPAAVGATTIDPDLGRGAIDHERAHRFAFKTPSLRNVGLTAPYMHNGVFRTLGEVVDFYDRGGGAGLGIDVPNQSLRRDRLGLSADERRDLIAFLESLTDTVIVRR